MIFLLSFQLLSIAIMMIVHFISISKLETHYHILMKFNEYWTWDVKIFVKFNTSKIQTCSLFVKNRQQSSGQNVE